MALNFLSKVSESEKDISISSIASFISSGHCVSKSNVDAKLVDSSICEGSLSQEESASTESGDDDFSSVHSVSASFTSKDSEVEDDDKCFSPRSADGSAVSCVYSLMLLMRVQAAVCGQSCSSGPKKSVLGYHTELVPDEAPLPWQLRQSEPKAAPKSRKSRKGAKQTSKARDATTALEQLPKSSLPTATDGSWITQQRPKVANADDDAKVIRATRSILNKLTIEKFDSLFEQLVACGISTPYHISTLMSEIFDKATTQHQFIPMYAELCVRLEKDPHIISCSPDFRRLLLNQCQNAFEQLLEPCSTESVADDEAKMRIKQAALGNIKLIGELLVQGMLSSSLFVDLGSELLQSRTECAEALECLAALTMVAGPKFDSADWQHHSRLEAMLSEIEKLTKDKSTPPRVRFLLRDVLDVRGAGWCTSANQAALKAAPMKLDAVREKVAEEHGVASPKRQKAPSFNSPSSKSSQSSSPSNKGTPSSSLLRLTEICRSPVVCSPANKAGGRSTKSRAGKAKKLPNDFNSEPTDVLSQCRSSLGKTQHDEKPVSTTDKQVEAKPVEEAVEEDFDLVTFRRTLSATLSKLQQDKNVPAAVQYIRLQEVPVEFQADQFVDILSRIVEERRGAVRRCGFAFAASLMANEGSPFDQKACFDGIRHFFTDDYADLCKEVQRLPAILRSEFLPTMFSVFPASELKEILPEEMLL